MSKDRKMLKALGFEGFKSMGELMAGENLLIPAQMGVYVVLRESDSEPQFLEEGTGGFYRRKNPNVSISELQSNWVEKTFIVYIGKAGGSKYSTTLNKRLGQYLRFGQGANVGHWGGRYIWQLQDSRDLIVCWKRLYSEEPLEVERQMIEDFKSSHSGRRPFANLMDSNKKNNNLNSTIMDMMKIEKINQVLADYFERNKNISQIPAMDLMNEFVKAGIFKSDSTDSPGLPIRKLLRKLDEDNQLDLIPYVVVERKTVNRSWYFTPRQNPTDSV